MLRTPFRLVATLTTLTGLLSSAAAQQPAKTAGLPHRSTRPRPGSIRPIGGLAGPRFGHRPERRGGHPRGGPVKTA